MVSAAAEQRRELGNFVRSQREKLAPASLGLSAGGRRRTPGLRREEAAQLAGLSVTWYTWLEQGREMSLSPAAMARLAKALRLDKAARAYLFRLAGKRDPEGDHRENGRLPAPVLATLTAIRTPAYILDRDWTAAGWNSEAEDLFSGWLDREGPHNLLRYIFTDPAARSLICDYERRARRVVAEFRSASSAHLDDLSFKAFIAELRRASPLFAQFWDQRDVVEREGGERTFNHPRHGFRRYEQATFDVTGHPDFKLTLLVAV